MNQRELKLKYRILLLGLVLGISSQAFAQDIAERQRRDFDARNCTQLLILAEEAYDEGRIDDVITLIAKAKCFIKGQDEFSSEETNRAHRLLSLAYLFTDNEPEAERSLVDLLIADPEHPIDPSEDPVEFIYLYKKYRVDPIFRIGLKLGMNRSTVRSLKTYNTWDLDTVPKTYAPSIGFQAELTAEYQVPVYYGKFLHGFEGIFGVGFHVQSYQVGFTMNTPEANAGLEGRSDMTETQNWLKLPLMLRYNIDLGENKKWFPYIYGGAAFEYMLSANMGGQRSGTLPKNVSNGDLQSFDMRKKINRSYFGGAGVKFKVNVDFLVVDVRYGVGADNFVKPDNRYANQNLLMDLGHVDDDLAIDNLSISVGYVKSLYKPRKYTDAQLAKLRKNTR